MTPATRELLERLHQAGIVLTVDGDRLRYRGPEGALTPALREALAEIKPDLIYEYHERAGILTYDAWLPEKEAEVLAADMVLRPGTPARPTRPPPFPVDGVEGYP